MIENNTNQNNEEEGKEFFIGKEELARFEGKRVRITARMLLKNGFGPIPCLIEPFLQKTGLACLAGSSDTGKSTLLRQLALAVVTGQQQFLGFTVNAVHKRAVYVSTEDDKIAMMYLLGSQAQNHDSEQLDNLELIFDTDDLLNNLDRSLTEAPADIVIIDCFTDAFGGDLKDTQKIRAYLHPYQQLAAKHECLVLFLHHTSKRTENLEPSKNNLLAGQGFEAKMRLVMELRADLMDPRLRHLCIVKGNYLSTAHKRESHVLHFDESAFAFTNTGDRVPFEFLVRSAEGDNGKAKYLEALEMRDIKKWSYEKIAEALGFGHRSSVSRLFERAKKMGWDKDTEPTEEPTE